LLPSLRLVGGAIVITFHRSYKCNLCRKISGRIAEAGDPTLWTDCDHCHNGPAHWCGEFPCVLCLGKFTMPTPEEIWAYLDDPFGDDTRPLTDDELDQFGVK